jgi:hypothetical protein
MPPRAAGVGRQLPLTTDLGAGPSLVVITRLIVRLFDMVRALEVVDPLQVVRLFDAVDALEVMRRFNVMHPLDVMHAFDVVGPLDMLHPLKVVRSLDALGGSLGKRRDGQCQQRDR